MRLAILMDDYDPCLSVNRFTWARWLRRGQLLDTGLVFSYFIRTTRRD